ncbi:cytochrome b [Chromobacterium haemolyticum]|uniref:cytochrome b n=1 Tax=Chromobacterium haemolyticum TaxID=394935 RepID=UPI004056626B
MLHALPHARTFLMLRNTSQRYGAVSRALHWLGALGVIAALIFIEAKGIFPKGTPLRDSVKYAHVQAGLLVLLLLFPRLIWRAGNPSPAITPQPGRLAALAAKAGHWSLYALMLALPLLGIAFIQAAGKNIAFFGFPLPLLLPPMPDISHDLKEAHEWLGNALMWLAILHAAAALWHHFIVKDNTLTRLIGPLRVSK